MKTRLIANPVSGRDEAVDHLPAINERLRASLGHVDIVLTVGQGDAERAAREAAVQGYEAVVVAGGDGTFNEAINGVAGAGRLRDVVFGLIPLGTGNDFATTLGLPDGAQDAADAVTGGGETRVDLGLLNDRLFVNASAGGFLAEVSDALSPQLKTIAGRLAYVIAGAGVLLDYEPPVGRATTGSEPHRPARYQLFVVSNGRTIGGGHLVAPRARFDDGLLDVCLVQTSGTPELVGLLRRISSGGHLDDPAVTYRQVATADFSFDAVVKVNTDGEVLETATCRYRVLPGALRVMGRAADKR